MRATGRPVLMRVRARDVKLMRQLSRGPGPRAWAEVASEVREPETQPCRVQWTRSLWRQLAYPEPAPAGHSGLAIRRGRVAGPGCQCAHRARCEQRPLAGQVMLRACGAVIAAAERQAYPANAAEIRVLCGRGHMAMKPTSPQCDGDTAHGRGPSEAPCRSRSSGAPDAEWKGITLPLGCGRLRSTWAG